MCRLFIFRYQIFYVKTKKTQCFFFLFHFMQEKRKTNCYVSFYNLKKYNLNKSTTDLFPFLLHQNEKRKTPLVSRNLRAYYICMDHLIMEKLDTYKDSISHIIESQHYTHTRAVHYLREKYGATKGLSERSLRKYCKINSIQDVNGNPSKS